MSRHLQRYGFAGSMELGPRYSAADEPPVNVEGWKVANPDYGQPRDMSGLTAGEKLAGLLDDPLFRAMKRLGRTMLDGTVTLARAVARPWRRPTGAHRAAVVLRKPQEASAQAAETVVLPVVVPQPLAAPATLEVSLPPIAPVNSGYDEWDGSPPPSSPVVVVPGRHSLPGAA